MVEFFLGVIKMSARLVFTGNRLKVKIIKPVNTHF